MTNDLSQIDTIDLFCCEFAKAIDEVKRVTKPNSTIALMIGDLRKKRKVVPLGFQTLKTCLDSGIILKEIIIKIQHNCASMGKWEIIAQKMGFLLLKHEYLFVFENC